MEQISHFFLLVYYLWYIFIASNDTEGHFVA